jgi:hypothetical protein
MKTITIPVTEYNSLKKENNRLRELVNKTAELFNSFKPGPGVVKAPSAPAKKETLKEKVERYDRLIDERQAKRAKAKK